MRTGPQGGAGASQCGADTDVIDLGARHFEDLSSQMASLLNTLESELQDLLWDSPAGDAFHQRYAEWHSAMQTASTSLSNIGQGLSGTSGTITRVEDENRQGMGTVPEIP